MWVVKPVILLKKDFEKGRMRMNEMAVTINPKVIPIKNNKIKTMCITGDEPNLSAAFDFIAESMSGTNYTHFTVHLKVDTCFRMI